MRTTYSQYILEEKNKIATFTFGRFSPPTIGHEKLIKAVVKHADNRKDVFIFGSNSQDAKKNPLSPKDKLKYMRLMFPLFASNILIKPDLRNVFDIASWLYNRGYESVRMVVGSDRVKEFKMLLSKYNNKKGAHGFYNFKNLEVISAGERDPDAKGVTGMSASKMRAAAADNNFDDFKKGLPTTYKDASKLFLAVKKGMKIT